MSKLTEIMKQIPLDEMMGDVDMKERKDTNDNDGRKIEMTSGRGALTGRRVGIIGTAAACAVLAAGGVFAYSKLSGPEKDTRATDIVSTADTDDSDAYARNAQFYRDIYKEIGSDYSLVENCVRPFAQETKEYDAEGGVKFRLVGTRAVGPFIMVDIGFENPDEVDLMQNASQDITLTLPDGSVIVGDRIPIATSAKAKIRLESFLFPQYVTDKDGNTHYIKDGDKLTFRIGTLAVDWGYFQAEANEDIKRHSYEITEEFTYKEAGCYEYTLKPDTVIGVPAFADDKKTSDDMIRIKEINYGAAGCSVVFSIEDADDEYRQAVLEKMHAEVYGDYRYDAEKQELIRPEEGYGDKYNEEFRKWAERYKETVTAYSDTESVRYMLHDEIPTRLRFDKLNDDGDFIISANYLNDPLDVTPITKFILGKNAQAEIEVPVSVPTDAEEIHTDIGKANTELYKAYYEHRDADIASVMNCITPFEEEVGAAEHEGLKFRVIGTRSIGDSLKVDIGIENTTDKDFDFSTFNEDIRLYIPDGRYITGQETGHGFIDKDKAVLSLAFPKMQKDDGTGGFKYIKDGDKLKLTVGRISFSYYDKEDPQNESKYEDIPFKDYSAEFTFTGGGSYDHIIKPQDTHVTWPALLLDENEGMVEKTDKVHIKEIRYSAAGTAMIFSLENCSDEYRQKVYDRMAANAGAMVGNGENRAAAVKDSVPIRFLLTSKGYDSSLMFEKLDNGDIIVYSDFIDDPLPVDEITGFVFGFSDDQSEIPAEKRTSEPESKLPTFEDVGVSFECVKMLYSAEGTDKIEAMVYLNFEKLPARDSDIDFDGSISVQLPDGRTVKLEHGSSTGWNINNEWSDYSVTYSGSIPVTELGLENGSEVKLIVQDLYSMAQVKLAEGRFEKTFKISYDEKDDKPAPADEDIIADFTSSHGQSILYSAAISGWTDEDGEHEFDKSKATVYDEPAARTKSGFEGMDFELAALAKAEDRYYAPVVNITCEKRDEILLTKDTDTSLGVENEFVLRTADGREIKAMGQGYMSKGTSWLILTPTFDVSEYGLKPGDKVTLVLTKLIAGNGTVIAEGEFTTELVLG